MCAMMERKKNVSAPIQLCVLPGQNHVNRLVYGLYIVLRSKPCAHPPWRRRRPLRWWPPPW